MKIETATQQDAMEVMDWLPDKESVMMWGSPYTRYPLREETFFTDIYWDRIKSCVARNEQGVLIAFGQYYSKLGRCHLARLIVNPGYRRQGHGLDFIASLMKVGGRDLGTEDFSLYVMTANKPAWNCYKSLGFEMRPYPDIDPHLDNCVFMVTERENA